MIGLADFGNNQRVLWEWFERRRSNTPEDLRLALLVAVGTLAVGLRKGNLLNMENLIGEVGLLFVAICSATDPGDHVVWNSAPDDQAISLPPSACLSRVIELSREEFPRLRFYRMVRYLGAACGMQPDNVVKTIIASIQDIVRRTDVPEGL